MQEYPMDVETRETALRLSIQSGDVADYVTPAEDVISRAEKFYAFLTKAPDEIDQAHQPPKG